MITLIKPSDNDCLSFSKKAGLVRLGEYFINNYDQDALIEEIRHNYFLKQCNWTIQELVTERMLRLQQQSQLLVDKVEERYGKKVVSISVGGTFTYKQHPGDLDLNVILEGAGVFDYYEYKDLTFGLPIDKTSVMVFSQEDIETGDYWPETDDTILTADFTHEDLIAREMIVAPLRNITFYGYALLANGLFMRDTLVRISRQLFFADMVLHGKISRYASSTKQVQKAASRINEAILLLNWLTEQLDNK